MRSGNVFEGCWPSAGAALPYSRPASSGEIIADGTTDELAETSFVNAVRVGEVGATAVDVEEIADWLEELVRWASGRHVEDVAAEDLRRGR